MVCAVQVQVAVVAIGTVLALPLSQALSSTNLNLRTTLPNPNAKSNSILCGSMPYAGGVPCRRQQESPSSPSLIILRAVAENTISTEACSEEADDTEIDIDVPKPLGTPQTATTAVEQHLWESDFETGNNFDNINIPTTPDSSNNVGSHNGSDDDDNEAAVDYSPFSNKLFHGGTIITEITNKSENSDIDSTVTDSDLDGLDDDSEAERRENSDNANNDHSSSDDDESDTNSVIRSTIAKSALLHRAGIAGTAKKSSRSNGRSSKARTHVNKSRRGSGRATQGVGSLGRVLGTVRTAAAAAAAVEQKKALEKNEGETNKSGENSARGDNNLTTDNSMGAKKTFSLDWKNAVESTIADMLKHEEAFTQQQSLRFTESSNNDDSPPPGTASMGLMGEVVQDKLPAIPPLPGAFLVRTNNGNNISTNKPEVTIRSSVPHSFDDTHIANLRLSVFSRFDAEQQQIFRSRSVEVLNVRRKRGAVVLVAEVPDGWPKETGHREHQHQFLNEMEARIMNGHKFGDIATVAHKPPSPSLTVTPMRGAKINSVSNRIALDFARAIGYVNDKENVQMPLNGRASSLETGKGSIIGSIECSHQEFRGTMLGNSRPKGSLMYVTEVAVRTDARRCGAGAMLMKGVDEVATLRNVETVYLHVDVTNKAACAMYEKCGYHYLDKLEPIYAQFTASLNLHDGAMHGRKHYLMCKNRTVKTTWLEDDDLCFPTALWGC